MSETSDVSKSRFYVYLLYSLRDGGFYLSFTSNLKQRLTQHAHGEVDSTKERLPITLIHYEYFINEAGAKAREVFLKSGYGRKQLKDILKRTIQT